MNLAVGPRNTASAPLVASDALEAEEIEQIQPNLVAVRCPDLSFGQDVTKIVLTRWIAHVGTRVEADEPIYELSTPAVDSEIPSPAAGILVEVLIQESSAVVKGQVLATILTDAVVSKDTGDPPLTREFIAASSRRAQGAGRNRASFECSEIHKHILRCRARRHQHAHDEKERRRP